MINAIVMSLRIGTFLRHALRFLLEADFLLRREHDALKTQSLSAQKLDRIVCDRACNGFRREIKYTVSHASAHGLHGRENGRNGLSNARRCLDKQLFLVINGLIDVGDQLLLAIPIGEGEGHGIEGRLTDPTPFPGVIRPLPILRDELHKPFFQLRKVKFLVEIAHVLRLEVAIGHPHLHPITPVLDRVEIAIALCLRHVHGNGPL